MLHPLFSAVIQRPDLIADHVAGYAELFHEEATHAGKELTSKLIAWLAAAVFSVIFVVFVGVALMLGATLSQFHWVLIAVPGVALLLAILSLLRAIKPFSNQAFPEIRAQIDSDIRALRSVV